MKLLSNEMIELNIIKEIAGKIVDAWQTRDWIAIRNHEALAKFKKSDKQYPPISSLFKPDDLEAIRGGIDIFNPVTPLEKLFYAVLWKNGDLLKLPHLVNGIIDEPNNTQAITFHRFGKFLAQPEENPIIDQHVIRAYKLVTTKDPIDDVLLKVIGKSGLLSSKDSDTCNNYIAWVKDQHEACPHEDRIHLFQVVDDVMFAFGRMIRYTSNPILKRK